MQSRQLERSMLHAGKVIAHDSCRPAPYWACAVCIWLSEIACAWFSAQAVLALAVSYSSRCQTVTGSMSLCRGWQQLRRTHAGVAEYWNRRRSTRARLCVEDCCCMACTWVLLQSRHATEKRASRLERAYQAVVEHGTKLYPHGWVHRFQKVCERPKAAESSRKQRCCVWVVLSITVRLVHGQVVHPTSTL
jgi:hypothetical protein